MNNEIKFKSLNELYKRLYPALNTRRKELSNQGLSIKELDIWNYLKDTSWSGNDDLSLYDMVKDILETKEDKLIDYIHKDD